METNHELLKPSLNADFDIRGLHSFKSSFIVAFIGGPISLAFYSLPNIKKLGDLRKDFWIPLLGVILHIGLLVLGMYSIINPEFQIVKSKQDLKFLIRFIAMALCGVYYLRFKNSFKTLNTHEDTFANPWPRALVSMLLTGIVVFMISFIFMMYIGA